MSPAETLPNLARLAHNLSINGPIIAENGGVARLTPEGQLVDLGYSRQPALAALARLKKLYPGAIKEREDNKDRLIDIVIWAHGITVPELRRHLGKIQVLDSGYILHLMQEGISKGRTLKELLGEIGDGRLSPENVLVLGDSVTDISLFELFPHNVFIKNPRLTAEQQQGMPEIARYASDLPVDKGFAEVISYLLDIR